MTTDSDHAGEWSVIPTPATLPTVAPCDWIEALNAPPENETAPIVVLDCRGGESEAVPDRAEALSSTVSEALRIWSEQRRFDSSTLLVLTRGAVAAAPGEDADPAGSQVWEIVRSARSAHPERILLVDSDSRDSGLGELSGILAVRNIAAKAVASTEPELAMRGDALRVPRRAASTSHDAAGPAAETSSGTPDPTIVGMFRRAITDGRTEEGLRLLSATASCRDLFDQPVAGIPGGIGISGGTPNSLAGTTMPHLVLVNTPAFLGGFVQYILLAAHLGAHRRVSAIPLTGYEEHEPLPASIDAAVESIARAVVEHVGDDPFVLGGLSAGGNIAHAVAGRLAERGNDKLRGLLILDAFLAQEANDRQSVGVGESLLQMDATIGDLAGFTTARLTAFAWWCDLLRTLEAKPVDCPTLYIKCTLPSPTHSLNEWPLEEWSTDQTVEYMAAEHLALCGTEAQTTAQIVDRWLSGPVADGTV